MKPLLFILAISAMVVSCSSSIDKKSGIRETHTDDASEASEFRNKSNYSPEWVEQITEDLDTDLWEIGNETDDYIVIVPDKSELDLLLYPKRFTFETLIEGGMNSTSPDVMNFIFQKKSFSCNMINRSGFRFQPTGKYSTEYTWNEVYEWMSKLAEKHSTANSFYE